MVRAWIVLCFCLGAVLIVAGCETAPKKSASIGSRVELAAGNVMVQQPDGGRTQAIAGQLLRQGATVRVGPGDRALIRLGNGSGVFLRHGTEVTLQPQGLALGAGEVWIEAPPSDKEPAQYSAGKVEVSANDAGLDLRRIGEQVELYVARGLAVVSSPGGRTEVKAGERATVAAGRSPEVKPVAFWEDWTGGMADRHLAAGSGGTGTGRIYALDRNRPGSPAQELEIRSQHVSVTVRGGVARTTVDQRFFNPGAAPVEGYYWFTIPENAAVDRFALDVQGSLIDGEVVERKQASQAYEASIQQSVDPALLEWIDGRTYRARIFPIPAAGDRRVVLSYMELLPAVDGRTQYVYPMGGSTVTVQEFSLEVDLGQGGEKLGLATTADARIEGGGRKVTVRRSGYKPQGDFLLEMSSLETKPLRAVQVASGRGEAAYVMLRYTPDVSWDQVTQVPGHVVVVVDTSAGGDDADRQLRADVAEAILRALSTSDRFALMAADLTPRVLYPASGLAAADEASIGKALEQLSAVRSGGATDLGAVVDLALQRLHGKAQPAVVYIGDGIPTVGELEGDALAERVTRSMAGASSRLFTIAVGGDARHALLARLARIGGGSSFRVDVAEQAVQEALRFIGHLKTPTITDLKLDLGAGLDQVFSSMAGKLSRGEEVTVLARSHHPLPGTIKVTGELGGKPFSRSYEVSAESGSEYSYVPTLWARQYLSQLLGAEEQKNRGVIIRLGTDYGLMTPFTSFLVLESDAAYQRFNIQRRARDPLWGLVPRAALEAAAAAPLALFGCSSEREAPSTAAVPAEYAARVRQEAVNRPMPVQPTVAAPAGVPAAEPPAAPRAAELEDAMGGMRQKVAISTGRRGVLRALGKGGGGRVDEALGEGKDANTEVAAAPVLYCSDAARRSLAHRRAIWSNQLDQAGNIHGWIAVYRRASSQCELPHWRDRKEMLDLIQRRVGSAAEVTALLGALGDAKAQDFVRRQLLRRSVSSELASASGDTVDWSVTEAVLSKINDPQQRIEELRRLCEANPGSASCAQRLISALLERGATSEALAIAMRLREDGRATPALMQQVGDLLAGAGKAPEAIRAYSEIVEFSPGDPSARRLLGDIYLRHAWYDLAYRQFRTLAQVHPDDPQAALRLAAAAAGTGRVDEALRLERKVAGGEGEPGPSDPRRWARLWSAARVARLMQGKSAGGESMRQSMERSLKRLQVLSSPGVLVLLTWEDLDARLTLSLSEGGRTLPSAERVNAGPTGLYAAGAPPVQGDTVTAQVTRAAGPSTRPVAFQLTTIVWDGKRLAVGGQAGKLSEASTSLNLALPR